MRSIYALALTALLGACATTDVQPLDQRTFKVATTAAPACGPSGARRVANQVAAIEVIRRGGDKFVFLTSEEANFYTGYGNTSFQQGLIVRLVSDRDPQARNALSARGILGPDWPRIVEKGVPMTC